MLTISYTILDGNCGALDGDRAAIETYAADLEAAFQAAYPDATVDVDIRWNTSGIGGGITIESDDDDCDTEAIELHLQHIGEKIFEVAGA